MISRALKLTNDFFINITTITCPLSHACQEQACHDRRDVSDKSARLTRFKPNMKKMLFFYLVGICLRKSFLKIIIVME